MVGQTSFKTQHSSKPWTLAAMAHSHPKYFRQTLIMYIKILLCILPILTIFGCKVSPSNFPEKEKLDLAIVKSIQIPFHYGDTVIYQPYIGICGNSSKDEIEKLYVPPLIEQPYFDFLKGSYKGVILSKSDSLYSLMNRQCNDYSDTLNVWDCFSRNKIDLKVSGETLTNKSLKIYETYSYNNEFISITKLFSYANKEWTYKIEKTNFKD